ncbi:MAG: hypothetical protein COA97_13270 [Flavobacteriales bacterium]|nr:MAG: hypothetical protein COA97_13270 [Flavobacteriales bacterium]
MNSCPTVFGDFSVSDWGSPTQGSPDYFNSCNSGDAGVPNNALGNQQAILGNAYVGFAIYDTFSTYSYREYLQVQLPQTLALGQKYWVSFYVSLADSSMYAIQELGAYFSPTQINDNISDTALPFIPQIEFNDSIITEKNDWIKISNSFIAAGNENYLLIGNFNRKQTTTAIQANNTSQNYSYYYVDNVCVSNDSLTCNQPVGVNEIEFNQSSFNLYPNPATDFFAINNASNQTYNLTIYNSIGQLLFEETNINKSTKKININNFNSNLLFIKIKTQNKSFTYKLLKP